MSSVRALACAMCVASAVTAAAQTPQPPTPSESVTFNEAISRAVARNPNTAIAAAGILRAQALLTQARSYALPQINGNVTTTTLNTGVEFDGVTVTPRNSLTGSLDLRMPLYSPAVWARRAEARENVDVATLSAAETRRQTALATADAYLTVIARKRSVESNTRARDTARAHFELAAQLEQGGQGSRLNRVRAEQQVSINQGFIENSQFELYRAQEALGILLVADGPVDASEDPTFDISGAASRGDVDSLRTNRSDLRLFDAQQTAAQHTLDNARKNYFPVLTGIFQPQTSYPSQAFSPQNTWRLLFSLDIPIWDSGTRASDTTLRRSALDVSRATLASAITNASSEVRTAREAVASAERALASARASAAQAQDVVQIVNISFRAGAATNIEVIDAERTSRDADTAVVIAEDGLRRSRFELLNAVGQFP